MPTELLLEMFQQTDSDHTPRHMSSTSRTTHHATSSTSRTAHASMTVIAPLSQKDTLTQTMRDFYHSEKTFAVYHPDLSTSLFLRRSFLHHCHHQQVANSYWRLKHHTAQPASDITPALSSAAAAAAEWQHRQRDNERHTLTSPAPWNRYVWSDSFVLVIRIAAMIPARATDAVPDAHTDTHCQTHNHSWIWQCKSGQTRLWFSAVT